MSDGDDVDNKIDPFALGVRAPQSEEEEGKGASGVKGLNPRVLMAGGLGAITLLGVMIVFMSVRAEDKMEAARKAELEDDRREFVEVDEGSASVEAQNRFQAAQDKVAAAEREEKELNEELVNKDKASVEPAVEPAVEQPGDAPVAPVDPGPSGSPSGLNTEPDPWVEARKRHISNRAQEHYALMGAARGAPIFTGGGSPQSSESSQGAQGGHVTGSGANLPNTQSPQEDAFVARLRQVQGQTMRDAQVQGGAGPVSPRSVGFQGSHSGRDKGFVTSTSPSSGGLTCAGAQWCVQAGTVVQAVLATAINSELPGMIVAQVVQPVWDPTLTRIVIPSGSKLLGEYNPNVEQGQTRTQVAWTRLILTNGQSVELGRFPAASLAGASGIPSEVDEHWDKLLQGVALSSAFSASSAALAGPVNQLSIDPRQQAISGAARPIQELGEERAQRYLEVGPTLRVPQGARVGMLIPNDLLLPPWRPRK